MDFLQSLLATLRCPVRKKEVEVAEPKARPSRRIPRDEVDARFKQSSTRLTAENLQKQQDHLQKDFLDSYIRGTSLGDEKDKPDGDDDSSSASGVTALTMTRMQEGFGGTKGPVSAEELARKVEAETQKKKGKDEATKPKQSSKQDAVACPPPASPPPANPPHAGGDTASSAPRIKSNKYASSPQLQKPSEVRMRRLGAAEGVTATVDYETMKQAIKEMKKEFQERKASGTSNDALPPHARDPALYLATKLAPGARLNASKFMSAPTRTTARTAGEAAKLEDTLKLPRRGAAASTKEDTKA